MKTVGDLRLLEKADAGVHNLDFTLADYVYRVWQVNIAQICCCSSRSVCWRIGVATLCMQ